MYNRSQKLRIALLTIPLFLLSVTPASAGWGMDIVWSLVINFIGTFTGIAGALLNYSATHFVVNFGAQFTTTGTGVAVDILWVKIRDIFNLTFIFGLVFIGIKMILNSDDAGTRRWLISLIMAALLVNFSLFITKFIVDITNLLATQVAAAFVHNGNIQISDKFMNLFGVTSIFTMPTGAPAGSTWGYIFGTAIVLIIMMFVFFAGGLLLVIRYAVLCLYMVLSPLMFLGWVFPQFAGVSRKYWSGFLGRAFFAPIYLILIYFSYFIADAFQQSRGGMGPNFQASLNATNGAQAMNNFGATWPSFFLISVFLIASVVAAQQLGLEGGSAAVKMMTNVKNNVQQRVNKAAARTAKAGYNAATYGHREALRRSSYALGRGLDRGLQRMQRSGGVVGSIARRGAIDRTVRGAASGLTNAKVGFQDDVRTQRARQTEINRRAGAAGDMAQSAQDARTTTQYSEQLRNQRLVGTNMSQMSIQEKANLGFNNLLGAVYAANLSDDDLKKFESEGHFNADKVRELREARNNAQLNPALAEVNRADIVELANPEANGRVATDAERVAYQSNQEEVATQRINKQAARDYLESSVKGMSKDTLLQMAQHPTQSAFLTNENVAQNFTDAQLNQLEASGMDVTNLRGARTQAMFTEMENVLDGTTSSAEQLENAFDKLGRVVKSLSGEKLTGMGMQKLTSERVAMHLSDSQIDTLQNSGQYSTDQIKQIKEARKRGLTAVASGNLTTPLTPGGKSMIYAGNTNTKQFIDPNKPGKGTFEQSRRQSLFRGGVKAAGALPPDVFADEASAPYITPAMLEERMNNYITQPEIDSIKDNLQNYFDALISLPSGATPAAQAKRKQWKKWSTNKGIWLGLDTSHF